LGGVVNGENSWLAMLICWDIQYVHVQMAAGD
jgi:hypothetical protein